MDLEPFVTPLSAEQPCGADLSFSPQVDAIRDMRREDDPTLAQGAWAAPLKTADWAGVARACETLLRTASKDLAVAGWLTEAWARLRGFEGLADGLELSAALIERHWPGLHPLADDGDQEPRTGCLAWLALRVRDLCGRVPLFECDGVPQCLVDVEAARQRKAAEADTAWPGAEGSPAPASSPPTLEALLRAVAAGGHAGFEARLRAIDAAAAALRRLQDAVDERLPQDGPSFVAARTALEQAAQAWARLGGEAGVAQPQPLSQPSLQAAVESVGALPAPARVAPAAAAAIQSRAQALQQLRLVAEYFRHAEPHSPVAYLADKAARWGEMPLHEWLRAVVKDGMGLASFEELLGVEPREPRG